MRHSASMSWYDWSLLWRDVQSYVSHIKNTCYEIVWSLVNDNIQHRISPNIMLKWYQNLSTTYLDDSPYKAIFFDRTKRLNKLCWVQRNSTTIECLDNFFRHIIYSLIHRKLVVWCGYILRIFWRVISETELIKTFVERILYFDSCPKPRTVSNVISLRPATQLLCFD